MLADDTPTPPAAELAAAAANTIVSEGAGMVARIGGGKGGRLAA